MDYEKKYKKALERAATELETCGADESLRNMIYAIFPDELKESEDEQTRKGLINFLKSPFIRENICDWKVAPWIALLEKQGEQKATTLWHDVSEVPDEMRELLVEWESPDATWHNIAFYDAETKAFRYLKQPINNVTRWAYVSDILTQSVTKISDKVWSEEDEEELGIAIKSLQQAGQWDSATWLQSLKDRVRPQPRQWSEEDEDNLRYSELHFKTFLSNSYYDTFCNWLKSIKERMGGK